MKNPFNPLVINFCIHIQHKGIAFYCKCICNKNKRNYKCIVEYFFSLLKNIFIKLITEYNKP